MAYCNIPRWINAGLASALVLTAGQWATGCRKSEGERQAERVQAQNDQAADNMKARADEIERNGREAARQQADQLRAQADRTHEEGKVRADEVRNEEHNVAGTPYQNVAVGTPTNYNGSPHHARGGGPSVQAALRSYAEARCNREIRCNNIGVGKHYRDVQACIADQVNDRSHSWEAASECRANGVNQAHLTECLSAVRTQDCGNPIDDLSRLAQCRVGEVCGQ